MRRIERTWRFTTPEEADERDREYYRSLTPNERVAELLELIDAWTGASQQGLERTYRVVSIPLPAPEASER